MSKNLVEPEAANDVTIWRIHIACWISKAIRTHAHAQALAPGHTHTTCARAHTHTQTNIIPLFHGNNDSRKRLSVTLYVHCLSCKRHAMRSYVFLLHCALECKSSVSKLVLNWLSTKSVQSYFTYT